MNPKYIPNILSFLRLCLIAPFLFFLYTEHYDYACYIFLTAGLTDAMDGWLARQFNWGSSFGQFMDPMADKLLITVSFISLALLGKLPWWLVVLVFLRDATISMGVLFWYRCIERTFNFVPSLLSKLNTALQILLVGVCLLDIAFSPLSPNPIPLLIYLTALTTTVTYIDYAWTWGKRTCSIKKQA